MQDGLGRVVLEAMASGIPVIAMNHTGPKELIEKAGEHTGILIDKLTELPQAMEEIITNKDKYIDRNEGRLFVKKNGSLSYLREAVMPAILKTGFGYI